VKRFAFAAALLIPSLAFGQAPPAGSKPRKNAPAFRTYGPLQKNSCPGPGQFYLDHVDANLSTDVCGGASSFDRIVRGGKPLSEEAVACLKSMGVTAIVDLRDVAHEQRDGDIDEKAVAEKLGLAYLNAPMHTTHDTTANASCAGKSEGLVKANLSSAVQTGTFIDEQLKNPKGKVYVHCTRGEDRTGFALMTYRVVADKCDKKTAHAEAASYGYSPYCALENAWALVPGPGD
jgi:hypothetical protein